MPDVVERRETGSDRSGAGAADPPSRAAPSLAILGADALLAAQPATAVQLAHACLRVGYQAVVPASWGDELVSGGCLKHLAFRHRSGETGPVIFCACPYVAHRLLAVGPDLEPFLASFVAPPVAVARYLRTLYAATRLRLTYIGRCPGAADDTIDARLTPEELLAVLAERGVNLTEQPRVFDSVIPPDRRRFLSQPGGLPTTEALRRADAGRQLVEVTGPELVTELAQHLLSRADMLIDVAARIGCACSGAPVDGTGDGARATVAALEPPRASSPVVDGRVPVALELPLPPTVRDLAEVVPSVAERRTSGASRVVQLPEPAPEAPPRSPTESPSESGSRRRSPTQGVTVRQPAGGIPTTRSGEGRALPRAYVARRSTGARGRGPSAPPRAEARRLDASGARDRGESSASSYAEERGAPPPERGDRSEWPERGGQGERPEMRARAPASLPPLPSGALSATPREPRTTAAAGGGVPDRAADPHGDESANGAGATALVEPAPREPPHAGAPAIDPAAPPIPAAEPRGPSPIAGPVMARAESLRARTTTLARLAVGAARQRRATVAALLAVALLSASVGVLAGRWLAARTESGESVKR